ncbi:hypothetical protein BSZ39_11720 [Bowdeniella nasicola]|uniref:Response regulatory domain-containing protein n=1 Tax=Bowdeniella nasicola TaxID=208480 RepID=A0A1Q5PZZ5_9ACTO|nr:response regulator transcription factor [Bowdeniella nasicola]OKL53022.1 hypothetical protein BSZ39_11720 [Bowdeniella nasicola]
MDEQQPEYIDVLIYSDDSTTRADVIGAVGRRAARGLPMIRWDETATAAAVQSKVAENDYAFLVLDGEAAKVGGMGLCKELKQEVFNCPPILVLIGRPQDTWLAHWSEADDILAAPLNPRDVQEKIAEIQRKL